MPVQGGPIPHLRLNLVTRSEEGMRAMQLRSQGMSFRAIAASMGLSLTTVWRRYWWALDYTLPRQWGRSVLRSPLPPQRGTAACPRGRPWIPAVDGPPPAGPDRFIRRGEQWAPFRG